jgi:hypothetical protein
VFAQANANRDVVGRIREQVSANTRRISLCKHSKCVLFVKYKSIDL